MTHFKRSQAERLAAVPIDNGADEAGPADVEELEEAAVTSTEVQVGSSLEMNDVKEPYVTIPETRERVCIQGVSRVMGTALYLKREEQDLSRLPENYFQDHLEGILKKGIDEAARYMVTDGGASKPLFIWYLEQLNLKSLPANIYPFSDELKSEARNEIQAAKNRLTPEQSDNVRQAVASLIADFMSEGDVCDEYFINWMKALQNILIENASTEQNPYRDKDTPKQLASDCGMLQSKIMFLEDGTSITIQGFIRNQLAGLERDMGYPEGLLSPFMDGFRARERRDASSSSQASDVSVATSPHGLFAAPLSAGSAVEEQLATDVDAMSLR